jgi:hypothetical protein
LAQQFAQGKTEVLLRLDSLPAAFQQQFSHILEGVHQNGVALAEIADRQLSLESGQNAIIQALNSQSEIATYIQAQQAAKLNELKIRDQQAGIYLLSSLFSIAGDAKLAREVSVVGNAAITVAGSINAIGKLVDTKNGGGGLGGLFNAGGAAAVGNIVGALFSILGLFDNGPTPEEMILDEIKNLREEVERFRGEMHSRFDRVDRTLNTILQEVSTQFNKIDVRLGVLTEEVSRVRSALFDIQGELTRLERKTFAYLDALSLRGLKEALDYAMFFKERTGTRMNYESFGIYESKFYTWATAHVFDDASSPIAGRSMNPNDLWTELTSTPPEKNLNYINEYVFRSLGVPRLSSAPLANPRDWAISATAYSRLAIENPFHYERGNFEPRLNNILSVGDQLAGFAQRTVRTPQGTPNTQLWQAMFNAYKGALGSLNAEYATVTESYALSHGYPPGSEPSVSITTNQIVADVTLSSVGGEPPSAIALSKTGDGLPAYFISANTIRRLSRERLVTTIAGKAEAGNSDGVGTAASFSRPQGLAVDDNGNIFVADTGNNTIRKIGTDLAVVTIAGLAGSTGNIDGTGSAARFNQPFGLACSADGALFVTDVWNHSIRKITPTGIVTTFAGNTGQIARGGSRDGAGVDARFFGPHGICISGQGIIYVTDTFNHTIRRIDGAGNVSTIAGWPGSNSSADGTGAWARFSFPQDIGATADDILFVVERGSRRVRMIDRLGRVSSVQSRNNPASTIAASGYDSMALRGGGTLISAGRTLVPEDWYSDLDICGEETPEAPQNLDKLIELSGEHWQYCALRSDGTVRNWGWIQGSSGRQSVGDTVIEARAPNDLSNVVCVSAGNSHATALKRDGTLQIWGNYITQHSTNRDGDYYVTVTPATLPTGLPPLVKISAAGSNNVGLTNDGSVVSWGRVGREGDAVGHGALWSLGAALAVPADLSNVVSVSAGHSHVLALLSDGTVRAWGVVPDEASHRFVQAAVPPNITRAIAIFAGTYQNLALRDDGTVIAWRSWKSYAEPVPSGVKDVVALDGGEDHSLVLKADGTVVGWGTTNPAWCPNGYHQYGFPVALTQSPPPTNPTTAEKISDAVFGLGSRMTVLDGSVFISDASGIRLAYPSAEARIGMYSHVRNELSQAGSQLQAERKLLGGYQQLLQHFGTVAFEESLETGDTLSTLLFGESGILGYDSVTTILETESLQLLNSWWPPRKKIDFYDLGGARVGALQTRVDQALAALSASLDGPRVSRIDRTVDRLLLLRASTGDGIPRPLLKILGADIGHVKVVLTGAPYIDYTVQDTLNGTNWQNFATFVEHGGSADLQLTNNARRFFRAFANPQ